MGVKTEEQNTLAFAGAMYVLRALVRETLGQQILVSRQENAVVQEMISKPDGRERNWQPRSFNEHRQHDR